MTNGSTGVNSTNILRSLFDVWQFIEDAKATGNVDPAKLEAAEDSFKSAHQELLASRDTSEPLQDNEQRCLGGFPYW